MCVCQQVGPYGQCCSGAQKEHLLCDWPQVHQRKRCCLVQGSHNAKEDGEREIYRGMGEVHKVLCTYIPEPLQCLP